MTELSDEFRTKMKEWIALKETLKKARGDMKLLNSREKELKLFIRKYMSANEIDTCNLRQGKVSRKQKTTKGTLSKMTIIVGLKQYLKNDEAVEQAMECIMAAREEKQTETISVTGLKSSDE